jgi:hypothetical protein
MNSKLHNSAKLLGAIFGGVLISLPAISVAQTQQAPINRAGSRVNPCPSIFYEEPHNNQVQVPQGCTPNAFTARMNAQGGMFNSSVAPTSDQTRLGVGGEAPGSNSYNNQRSYNNTNQSNAGAVPSPEPLNNPNSGIPNSQIDSRTGNRVNGPAGGYTNLRQSQQNQQSNLGGRYQNAVAAVSPSDGRVTIRLINNTNAPISFQAIGDTQIRTLAGRSEIALQGLRIPTTVTFYRQDRGLLMVTPKSSESGVLEVTMQETTDFAMDRTALRIENNGSVYLN